MDGSVVLRWTMAASLAIAACADKGEGTSEATSQSSNDGSGESAAASTESSSSASGSGEATTASPTSSDSATSSETTDTDSPTSASSEGSADSSAEESDEQSGTGEPGGPCANDDLEIGDVVLDVTTNRVMDEDVATSYDPDQGSHACVQVDGNELTLFVQYGPFDFDGLQSSLILTVAAVGLYDLTTDVGTPGTGMGGALELSYTYDFEPATTATYSTQNQAATGTVDVIALPTNGGTTYEFAAQGDIAGSDGWQFDLTFTGTVVRGG